MKQLLVLVLLGGWVGGFLSAENTATPEVISAQVGLGPSPSGLLHLQGGVDFGLGHFSLGPELPLTWGVASRVGLQGSGLDAEMLATVRYSWKSLSRKWEWLDAWDTYAGLGIQVIPELAGAGLFGVAFHPDKHWGGFAEVSTLSWPLVVGAFYRW